MGCAINVWKLLALTNWITWQEWLKKWELHSTTSSALWESKYRSQFLVDNGLRLLRSSCCSCSCCWGACCVEKRFLWTVALLPHKLAAVWEVDVRAVLIAVRHVLSWHALWLEEKRCSGSHPSIFERREKAGVWKRIVGLQGWYGALLLLGLVFHGCPFPAHLHTACPWAEVTHHCEIFLPALDLACLPCPGNEEVHSPTGEGPHPLLFEGSKASVTCGRRHLKYLDWLLTDLDKGWKNLPVQLLGLWWPELPEIFWQRMAGPCLTPQAGSIHVLGYCCIFSYFWTKPLCFQRETLKIHYLPRTKKRTLWESVCFTNDHEFLSLKFFIKRAPPRACMDLNC